MLTDGAGSSAPSGHESGRIQAVWSKKTKRRNGRPAQPTGGRIEWSFYQPFCQYESFNASSLEEPSWQQRATEALKRLTLEPQLANELEELDISAEGARVLQDEEVIEAMIVHRIREEELRIGLGKRESPQVLPKSRKRYKSKQPEEFTEAQAAVLESEAGLPDLEEIAPIRTYAEIHKDRIEKMHTESAKLLEEDAKMPARWKRNIESRSIRSTRPRSSRPSHVLPSALPSHPHRQAVQRSARRFQPVDATPRCPSASSTSPSVSSRGCPGKDPAASLQLSSSEPSIPADVRRVAPNEVILTVAVCSKTGRKEQEFDVLATQRLWELRDAFHFVADWMFDGPTRIKSACFFIDGIFYVDRRDPTALDYSKEIIPWVKETRDPGFLRANESRSMDTRLCDLDRVPIGQRCVYIHQGDIEHSIFFTGARLLHHDDCPLVEAYPLLVFMREYTKKYCYACLQALAVWLVLDSSRCPHNPSFWCQNCFRQFFQDIDGNFVQPVDYKVFPYLHDDPDDNIAKSF